MELSLVKKKLVKLFMSKGVLISPEFAQGLSNAPEEKVNDIISKLTEEGPLFLNDKLQEFFESGKEINWQEFEKLMVSVQREGDEKILDKAFDTYQETEKTTDDVEVLFTYEDNYDKKDVSTFVSYFNERYKNLRSILQNRQELEKASAISRIKVKQERENVSLIGMVNEKSVTKNGNIILGVEDPSGEMNVLVNKSKQELFAKTKDVVLDEVIGVSGVSSNGIVFVDQIFFPDVPLHHELKKSPKDENVAVLGDIHVGSRHFLYDQFNKMIKWLKGEFGNDRQREEAKKIKYLVLIGDLVDGAGIYPGQENDLEIKDIYEQYAALANYLKKIPSHINIIICAGNHDAVRLAEPQPKLPKDFAQAIWDMPNVTMVSNPSIVKIGGDDDFPGLHLLLYHGFSFTYYGEMVESIRSKGGLERVELIIEFLLKKRHLAPSHTSNQYIPDKREDFMTIKTVPDIFITGHVHRTSITNYRNVTMINGSSWMGMTDFQE